MKNASEHLLPVIESDFQEMFITCNSKFYKSLTMQYIIIDHFKRNVNKYKTCIYVKVVKRNLRIFPYMYLFFNAHYFDGK